jgi:DNA-binding transcriptional ArsR family regulator
MAPQQTTAKSERTRTVEEALSYAVAHRVRIEILCLLNEQSHSAQELAHLVNQRLSTVTHHIEELFNSGSIEIAKTKQVRNIKQNFYRAVAIPFLSDEEMQALTPEARQEIYGLILQASMAEAMASFLAGKITNDPRVMLAWRWFNVDERGRAEIADEQAESWERIKKIEAESTNRRARTDEPVQSIIVTSLGYERNRTSSNPAPHVRK